MVNGDSVDIDRGSMLTTVELLGPRCCRSERPGRNTSTCQARDGSPSALVTVSASPLERSRGIAAVKAVLA